MIEVVWFKRDLRTHDHAALAGALDRGPTLALYIIEPELWTQPDRSWRQWAFLKDCLKSLDAELREQGGELCVRVGDALEVFESLRQRYGSLRIHAHEETGTRWTDLRDIALRRWCREQQVPLIEHRQFGVFRPLKDRNGWAGHWKRQMMQPLVTLPEHFEWQQEQATTGWEDWSPELEQEDCAVQPGGTDHGRRLMRSFLESRGESYHRELSSPETAEDSCSRLSAHLSLGSLSLRELAQRTWRAQQGARGRGGTWPRALKAFEGRLHWHCHFIQKFESEPRIEFENLARSTDGLREDEFDPDRFEAWRHGLTGYPFVDACMRYLNATGWLNFRMRAMLAAFSAYHLWQHWRQPALHLARCFTDYEAGIHFSQMQMQSGTTGINSVRIYNPVKQSMEHDPNGDFIRRWVPELEGVSAQWIHEPWRMPASMQVAQGCRIPGNYPAPIVDHIAAARTARRRMAKVRAPEEAFRESKDIFRRHGSRRRR